MKKNFWKIAFFVVGIPSCLWFCIDLCGKFIPKGKLTAYVHSGQFIIPPAIDGEFKAMNDMASVENLMANERVSRKLDQVKDESTRKIAEEMIERVSSVIQRNIPDSLPSEYRFIDGYWSVKVINNCKEQVTSVRIFLPRTAYVVMKKESDAALSEWSDELLEIGTLQPQEEVDIMAWSSVYPIRSHKDDIKLTHSEGTGKVKVYEPVSPFWSFVAENVGFFMSGIQFTFLLVALVLLLIYSASMLSKKNQKPDESREQGETETDEPASQ